MIGKTLLLLAARHPRSHSERLWPCALISRLRHAPPRRLMTATNG